MEKIPALWKTKAHTLRMLQRGIRHLDPVFHAGQIYAIRQAIRAVKESRSSWIEIKQPSLESLRRVNDSRLRQESRRKGKP